MTNSWMNEDGEPIMDGAAWRFEQQLDMESAAEREYDRFYANDGCGTCEGDEDYVTEELDGRCDECGLLGSAPEDDDYINEDAAMEFGLFGSEA